MLQAGNEGNMAQAFLRRQRIEHIAHKRGIDADIVGFSFLAHPRGNEEVRGRHLGQRGAQGCRIEHVSGDVPHSGEISRCAAR